MNAKRSLARQHSRDRRAARAETLSAPEDLSWREVQALLDEEVERLPDIYRRVFVLCGLHEHSREEAARQLGLKEGTVSSRLAKARRLLQDRLARRGVTLSPLLAAIDLTREGARVGAATVRATVKVILTRTVGARVAALAEGVAPAGLFTKTKVATALVLLAALLAGGAVLLASAARRATGEAKAAAQAPQKGEKEEKKTPVELHGRVLAPDGQPVPGARVEARLLAPGRTGDAFGAAKTTEKDGRFRLSFSKRPQEKVVVVAMARGLGLEWAEAKQAKEELTLKLVADQTLAGEVVSLEGLPIKGARLRILHIEAPLEADWMAHQEQAELGQARSRALDVRALPEHLRVATADERGRLRLEGLGRERRVVAVLEGPGIASTEVWVFTRPKPLPPMRQVFPIHPAEFRHLAAPSRPVVGVVRDRVTKKPLAGVTVRSEKLGNQYWWGSRYVVTRTDEQGRYRLLGLPKGKGNEIAVEAPADKPYLGVTLTVPDPVGGEPVTMDVDLHRGVWVEGLVSDESTRRPVAGAQVDYFPAPGNPYAEDAVGKLGGHLLYPRVKSSGDGRFRLAAPPGKGMIAVRAGKEFLFLLEQGPLEDDLAAFRFVSSPGGYHRLVAVEAAKDAARVRCDLALLRGEKIPGKVVDPEGKEVNGAWAWNLGNGLEGWRRPLKSGRFTLWAFNRKHPRFVAFIHRERNLAGLLTGPPARGRQDPKGAATPALVLDDRGEVLVKLEKAGTLTGRVVDAAGKPRARLVLAIYLTAGTEPINHLPEAVRTDAEGRFKLTGLIPGVSYVIATQDGEQVLGWYRLSAGQTKDLGAVQLRKP